jgi:hypothetical protein
MGGSSGSGFFWVTLYVYEKIKQKKTPVVYKTDQIANLHGHEVLRTPIRHCELNPIAQPS